MNKSIYIQENPKMAFKENLVELRKQNRLTQEELGYLSSIQKNLISRLERGETKDPQLSTLLKLSKALNCTLNDLVYDENTLGPDENFKKLFNKLKDASPERRQMAESFLHTLIIAETSDELKRQN